MRRHSPAPASDAVAQKRGGLSPIASWSVGGCRTAGRAAGSRSTARVSATTTAEAGQRADGHLNDRSTRSGAVYRPLGSSSWTLVTPQGVADNGGLVLDTTSGRPSSASSRPGLKLSPLARAATGVRPGTRVSSPELAAAPTPRRQPSIDRWPWCAAMGPGAQPLAVAHQLTPADVWHGPRRHAAGRAAAWPD